MGGLPKSASETKVSQNVEDHLVALGEEPMQESDQGLLVRYDIQSMFISVCTSRPSQYKRETDTIGTAPNSLGLYCN
jgi:hypothetical protein